jgi:hypothetical protein
MNQAKQSRIFWALLALWFLCFLLLNILTPLVSDDYRYAFSFATDERITSVWQIFPSLYTHYFVMHGRTAVHFFTQLFLLLGKPVFNVCNAAVAALLLLGLHRIAMGRKQKSPAVLLALGALIFLFTPAFGQTMLWLDGACNYLWGVTITVWVLIPFRDALLREEGAKPPFRDALLREEGAKPPVQDAFAGGKGIRSPWLLALFFFGSLFMGAASENTSPAALAGMLLCIAILWKKTGRPDGRLCVSAGLAVIGFLILALSPANAVRSAYYATEGVSRMGQTLLNFQAAAQTLNSNGLPLIGIFLVLFAVAAAQKVDRDRLTLAALLFLAGLLANFAMTLSNGYPLRAMTGCAVFFMAGIGVLLPGALSGGFRPLALGAIAFAVCAALLTAAAVLPGNYNRYAEARAREAYVTQQRDQGNLNVTTYTLEGKSRYDVFDGITDISFDVTYWPNVYYAKYYGLESVVTDTIR